MIGDPLPAKHAKDEDDDPVPPMSNNYNADQWMSSSVEEGLSRMD